jgi:acyl-coenzyme A thioesterase PaaI-like protein
MSTLPEDPRSVYTTNDPEEGAPRAAKHELVRQVKRVVEDVALLDVSRMDVEDVRALAVEARRLADRLSALPTLLDHGGLATSGPDDGALMERSGIAGRSNPLAPPLHLEMGDDGITRGHAIYTPVYEGPPGCVHGGFVAAAFDDLMGFAQMASGRAGYTGTLTVKMLKPTPLGRRIDYEAGVDHAEGRKIWVRAKSWDGDTQLAEATILFIAPKTGHPGLNRPYA